MCRTRRCRTTKTSVALSTTTDEPLSADMASRRTEAASAREKAPRSGGTQDEASKE